MAGNCPDLEIELLPTDGAPFAIPHGLGHTPCLVLIQMATDGEIWFQPMRYDSTNIYLQASSGGITGYAQIWA